MGGQKARSLIFHSALQRSQGPQGAIQGGRICFPGLPLNCAVRGTTIPYPWRVSLRGGTTDVTPSRQRVCIGSTPLNALSNPEGNPRHFLLVRSCFNGRRAVVKGVDNSYPLQRNYRPTGAHEQRTNKGKFQIEARKIFHLPGYLKREARGADGHMKQRRSKESVVKSVKRPHPWPHLKRACTLWTPYAARWRDGSAENTTEDT